MEQDRKKYSTPNLKQITKDCCIEKLIKRYYNETRKIRPEHQKELYEQTCEIIGSKPSDNYNIEK